MPDPMKIYSYGFERRGSFCRVNEFWENEDGARREIASIRQKLIEEGRKESIPAMTILRFEIDILNVSSIVKLLSEGEDAVSDFVGPGRIVETIRAP